jgi:mannose-1-phosphate guanylyltransferase
MQGIILVGGEGTRLRPLTYGTPKAMVPILGRPFLEHMLVYLRRHGVTDVALALGHLPDQIQRYFGDGLRWGVRLRTVVEPEPLGSGGAIKQFEPELQAPFFAFNGDILTDFDLVAMLREHRERGAAVSIALMEVENTAGFGVVALDETRRILQFVEKPPPELAPSRWANAGIWLFEPRVLLRVPAGVRSMVETGLFPELIAAGERVQGYCERGFWVDIGTPERYLEVQLRLLREPALRILPLTTWPGTALLSCEEEPAEAPAPHIGPDVVIVGPVLLGRGVRVESGARLLGPLALGDGCVVRRGALVSESVLWAGCVVGEQAEVRRSALAERVQVGGASRLSNVTAGHDARIAEGAELSAALIPPAGLTPGP